MKKFANRCENFFKKLLKLPGLCAIVQFTPSYPLFCKKIVTYSPLNWCVGRRTPVTFICECPQEWDPYLSKKSDEWVATCVPNCSCSFARDNQNMCTQTKLMLKLSSRQPNIYATKGTFLACTFYLTWHCQWIAKYENNSSISSLIDYTHSTSLVTKVILLYGKL